MLLVVGVDLFRGQDLLLHGRPLGAGPDAVDLLVDLQQQGIAGTTGNGQMELAVAPGKGVLVGAAILQLHQDRLHGLQVALVGMQGGQARHVGFDGGPRLDQLQGADQIGDLAGAAVHRPGVVHEGAAAHPAHHHPVLLELVEGLADGAAGTAEGGRQMTLRRQLVAVGVDTGLDGVAQTSGDRRGPGPRRRGELFGLVDLCPGRDLDSLCQRSLRSANWPINRPKLARIGLKSARLCAVLMLGP